MAMDVTVPVKLWKVILVLPEEDAEPTKRTRTSAIIMPLLPNHLLSLLPRIALRT